MTRQGNERLKTEEPMSSNPEFIQHTDEAWNCVDGRKCIAIITKDENGNWVVMYRENPQKSEEVPQGPQALGASLGFVAAAKEIGKLNDEDAFDVVEEAHVRLGLRPQYHIDSHNDVLHDISHLNDEELIEAMLAVLKGCGFAAYYFKENADKYIQMAQSREWSIQLLGGDHDEKKASKNYVAGTTFDTAGAVDDSSREAGFNQDTGDVREMLGVMEKIMMERGMIQEPGFAEQADNWLDFTYNDVVGVLTRSTVNITPDQIIQVR
jgi:hypothetical protein